MSKEELGGYLEGDKFQNERPPASFEVEPREVGTHDEPTLLLESVFLLCDPARLCPPPSFFFFPSLLERCRPTGSHRADNASPFVRRICIFKRRPTVWQARGFSAQTLRFRLRTASDDDDDEFFQKPDLSILQDNEFLFSFFS